MIIGVMGPVAKKLRPPEKASSAIRPAITKRYPGSVGTTMRPGPRVDGMCGRALIHLVFSEIGPVVNEGVGS